MGTLANVKRGDTDTTWKLNMDLTGSTIRVLVRSRSKPVTMTELTSEIVDAENGIVSANTSVLPVGSYDVEVEVMQGPKIYTFPDSGFASLSINTDLG